MHQHRRDWNNCCLIGSELSTLPKHTSRHEENPLWNLHQNLKEYPTTMQHFQCNTGTPWKCMQFCCKILGKPKRLWITLRWISEEFPLLKGLILSHRVKLSEGLMRRTRKCLPKLSLKAVLMELPRYSLIIWDLVLVTWCTCQRQVLKVMNQ